MGGVVWQTLKDFGRETSISGLNNAARAKSTVRFWLWMALFCLGTYLTADGIWYVLQDFKRKPYTTITSLSHMSSVKFPAVTVCNHNR